MADLVSRKEWGAAAPSGPYTAVRSTRGVKVHYTGGRVDPAILDDHSVCVRLVRDIQRMHMSGGRGEKYIDIGYTAAACPHRKVFVGRGPGRLPAANGPGLNAGHYAVLALVGSSGFTQPNDGVLHAIRDAIEWLRAEGRAGSEIKGHRDGYPTACPGDPLYQWVKKGAPRPGGGGGASAKPATSKSSGGGVPPWPGRYLRYPPVVRGDDVRTWQSQMRRRGWRIDVDGAYGPQSRQVCLAFQREKRLAVDGIVGPETWRAAWTAPIT